MNIPNRLIEIASQAIINSYEGKYGKVNDKIFAVTQKFKVKHTDGIVSQYNNWIVVCFRGSNGKADWKDNFKFGLQNYDIYGAKVHTGFVSQWLTVSGNILEEIIPFDKVLVCGHSLGGAIATICAQSIKTAFPGKEVVCITWGSPRVGNGKFKKLFNKTIANSLRFVYKNDIVCKVPFSVLFNYRHVAKKIHVGKVTLKELFTKFTGSKEDHYPQKYFAEIKKWLSKREDK